MEAAKNGTFLVTSQIIGLMLSTLSRGFIPADSVGRAFIELVLYVPFRIFSCLAAIYFEVARRILKQEPRGGNVPDIATCFLESCNEESFG